jgi:hypothetical protein
MTIAEARAIVLRRFVQAGRTDDITREGLLDSYSGSASDLVRALYLAGLLERVRGSRRGVVYLTSDLGRQLIGEPPRGA